MVVIGSRDPARCTRGREGEREGWQARSVGDAERSRATGSSHIRTDIFHVVDHGEDGAAENSSRRGHPFFQPLGRSLWR